MPEQPKIDYSTLSIAQLERELALLAEELADAHATVEGVEEDIRNVKEELAKRK